MTTSINPKPGQVVLWQREFMPGPLKARVLAVSPHTVQLDNGLMVNRGTTWFGDPNQPQGPIPDPQPEKLQGPEEEDMICERCGADYKGGPISHFCQPCRRKATGDATSARLKSVRDNVTKKECTCEACATSFQPLANNARFCPPCRRKRRAEKLREYRLADRAKRKAAKPAPCFGHPAEDDEPAKPRTMTAELTTKSLRQLLAAVGRARKITVIIEPE
jgi:hypothetical protein